MAQSLKIALSGRPLDLTVSLRTVIGEGVTFLEALVCVVEKRGLVVVVRVAAILGVDVGGGF